jgi:hypothetical protein
LPKGSVLNWLPIFECARKGAGGHVPGCGHLIGIAAHAKGGTTK